MFNVPTSLIIESTGWRTAMTLLAGIAFGLSLLTAVIVRPRGVVKQAGTLETEEEGQVSTGQMMKSARFYVYFLWSVLVLAGCSSLTGTAVSVVWDQRDDGSDAVNDHLAVQFALACVLRDYLR